MAIESLGAPVRSVPPPAPQKLREPAPPESEQRPEETPGNVSASPAEPESEPASGGSADLSALRGSLVDIYA